MLGGTASDFAFENAEQDNYSFDEIKPRKTGPRITNIGYDDSNKHFGYEEHGGSFGPQNWGKINSNCDGKHQSPINIDLKSSKPFSGPPLVIKGFETVPSSILMDNNGHSVLIKMIFNDNSHVTISGGPLEGSYVMDNIHWHWGKSDTAGSEHAIDGIRSAAEMHIVLHSTKFCELSHR